ncbi:ion transporter [bacterium]|nr:ion transporter [bacterium]
MSDSATLPPVSLTERARTLVEADWFTTLVTSVIIINAILLGIDTYDFVSPGAHRLIDFADVLITAFFVFELGCKIFAYRWKFFSTGWNVFDMVVVLVALLPNLGQFSVLRALRVLRVLRLVSVVPTMRRVIEALFRAIPGMGAILAVLVLIVYVGAVMATNLYGDAVPQKFGTLERAAFTLFQLMTLDGWRGEIVQPVMDAGHPYSWIFFLSFMLVGAFAILNLFMALIVDSMNDDVERGISEIEGKQDALRKAQTEADESRAELTRIVIAISEELADIRTALEAKPKPPARRPKKTPDQG